jgi:pimeloyl-ACP methyl ester carboxylesterase
MGVGTTFVLVHGAWAGGWKFRRVAERLRAKGHTVLTPTLTGCGERSHLLSATISLSTHIQDVLNVFRWEQIDKAVLAGHSYGGMVITGVADRISGKISALVYLDAFIPEDGQSLFDINIPENTLKFIHGAGEHGGIAVPVPPAAFFNVNEKDVALYDALSTPQPLANFTERISLTGAHQSIKKRIYVHSTVLPRQSPFKPFYERCKADPAWVTHTLACGHDAMLDEPDRTTEILLSAI